MSSHSQTQSNPKNQNPETEITPQPGSPAKNFPPPRPFDKGNNNKEGKPSLSPARGNEQNSTTQNQQKREQSQQPPKHGQPQSRNPEHPEKPAPEHKQNEAGVDDEAETPVKVGKQGPKDE